MSRPVLERRTIRDRRVGERRHFSTARSHGRRRSDRIPNVPQWHARTAEAKSTALPRLLTVDEVAYALRTTRKAVYALIQRGHLPGVVRVQRRVLVRQIALLEWLHEKGAPSSEDRR
jgi:excisionase family DNA binding protein